MSLLTWSLNKIMITCRDCFIFSRVNFLTLLILYCQNLKFLRIFFSHQSFNIYLFSVFNVLLLLSFKMYLFIIMLIFSFFPSCQKLVYCITFWLTDFQFLVFYFTYSCYYLIIFSFYFTSILHSGISCLIFT